MSALLWKEQDLFVAKAIEVEVASQGHTKEEAISNLEEALELYFEDSKLPKSKILHYKGLELINISPAPKGVYA